MTEELKPCPFCGRNSWVYFEPVLGDSFIHCQDCLASGPAADTQAGAIEEWNERAGDKAHEILGRVCRYLLLVPTYALPAALWNAMLDEIPEQERQVI